MNGYYGGYGTWTRRISTSHTQIKKSKILHTHTHTHTLINGFGQYPRGGFICHP